MAPENICGEYWGSWINMKTFMNMHCPLVTPAQPSYHGCGLLPHHCPGWEYLLLHSHPMCISKGSYGEFSTLPVTSILWYPLLMPIPCQTVVLQHQLHPCAYSCCSTWVWKWRVEVLWRHTGSALLLISSIWNMVRGSRQNQHAAMDPGNKNSHPCWDTVIL